MATKTVPKAFDFTGDVAIVSGAGSRMDGKRLVILGWFFLVSDS